MKLRAIEPRDAEAILGIQAESPEVAEWSRHSYERLTQENMTGWVAEVDGRILGFIVVRQVAGDGEILNLAVSPKDRRRGVGTALLIQTEAWAK